MYIIGSFTELTCVYPQREQLHSHETKVQDLEEELHGHRAAAPEKGAKASVIQDYLDKEIYLEYEV